MRARGKSVASLGFLEDRFGYGIVFLIGGLASSFGFAQIIVISRRVGSRRRLRAALEHAGPTSNTKTH
jgi:hypothetical protein